MFSQAAPFVIWPLHKHVVVETHEALGHQIYSSRFCGGLEFLFEMSDLHRRLVSLHLKLFGKLLVRVHQLYPLGLQGRKRQLTILVQSLFRFQCLFGPFQFLRKLQEIVGVVL